MKKIVFLFLLLNFITYAQEEDDFAYLEKIIPPSPTASSLGTYGNVPINLSNGSPNVNLPIYNLQAKNINIPISIAYNSNGVRIDDVPGQLGVDWNLLVGGVVTHTVYDEDDLSNAPYFDMEGDFCSTEFEEGIELSSPGTDSQKDIFNYNVMGIAGSFVLDENEEPIQLDYSDTKIEKINNGPSNTYILGFKITDIQGNQYFFGELQDGDPVIEKTRSRGLCGSPSPTLHHVTAWFLTSIHYTTGETVSFHYINKDFNYISGYEQTGYSSVPLSTQTKVFALNSPCGITERHFTYYLDEIEYNTNKIKFDYVEFNTTVPTGFNTPEQLENISIYYDTALIRKFEFNYDEVSPNTSSYLINQYTEDDIKRIFLKEVLEYDNSEQNSFKKYAFDYYTPEDLPPRHSFSKDIYGYYNGAHNTNLIYKNWSDDLDENLHFTYSFSIANRDPTGSAKGMLHHLYYPTGGDSEFIYEPNVVQTTEIVPPPTITAHVAYEATTEHPYEESSSPFTVLFDQTASMSAVAELNLFQEEGQICGAGSPYDDPPGELYAYLLDYDTDDVIEYLYAHPNILQDVQLLANKTYYIKVQTNHPCIRGYAHVEYLSSYPDTVTIDKPVGGMRVKRTLDHDNTGNEHIKRYYYGSLEDVQKSSFHYNIASSPSQIFNLDYSPLVSTAPNVSSMENYLTYSSPKTPLYNLNGSFFSYKYVTESLGGDDFEKGGTEHTFNFDPAQVLVLACGVDYVRGTPFSNVHNSDKEISSKAFKKETGNYVVNSIKENHYAQKDIGVFNLENLSYNISQTNVFLVLGAPATNYDFNAFKYYLTGEAWYLSSTKNTVYDTNGENPVETTTTYTYDNPDHLQLTKQTTTVSDGESRITEYQYPPDLIGLEQGTYMQDLTTANRIAEPVITETKFKKGTTTEKTSEQHIKYGNSSSTGNLLLPTEIHTKKGSGNIDITSIEDRKITYTKYDTNGNLLEYKLENGISVSIIWGYNKQYPIAKIEGKGYADAEEFVVDLQTESDAGTLTMDDFDDLRDELNDALVTTYIYQPLIGVTDILYPNGSVEHYEYDDFGRLKQVKNGQDEVIKKMEYHYQTP